MSHGFNDTKFCNDIIALADEEETKTNGIALSKLLLASCYQAEFTEKIIDYLHKVIPVLRNLSRKGTLFEYQVAYDAHLKGVVKYATHIGFLCIKECDTLAHIQDFVTTILY